MGERVMVEGEGGEGGGNGGGEGEEGERRLARLGVRVCGCTLSMPEGSIYVGR